MQICKACCQHWREVTGHHIKIRLRRSVRWHCALGKPGPPKTLNTRLETPQDKCPYGVDLYLATDLHAYTYSHILTHISSYIMHIMYIIYTCRHICGSNSLVLVVYCLSIFGFANGTVMHNSMFSSRFVFLHVSRLHFACCVTNSPFPATCAGQSNGNNSWPGRPGRHGALHGESFTKLQCCSMLFLFAPIPGLMVLQSC